jgi:hypothetical protein
VYTAYVVVTVVAAMTTAYAAIVDFSRPRWILNNMTKYGVPHSWLPTLGALKAVGALGLLVGLAVPMIEVAASIGLVLFFLGAIVTVIHARWYSHIPAPALFLLPVTGSLVLQLAASR